MSEETSYIRCKAAKKIDLVSGKNERFSVEKRNFFGRNNDGNATDKKNFCTTPQKQAIQQKYVLKHRLIPSKKLMLWECIRSNGEKIIVPIKNKVDASCYIQIVKDHALNFMDLHEIFQQDNAPAHSAEKTQIFSRKMPSYV